MNVDRNYIGAAGKISDHELWDQVSQIGFVDYVLKMLALYATLKTWSDFSFSRTSSTRSSQGVFHDDHRAKTPIKTMQKSQLHSQ